MFMTSSHSPVQSMEDRGAWRPSEESSKPRPDDAPVDVFLTLMDTAGRKGEGC